MSIHKVLCLSYHQANTGARLLYTKAKEADTSLSDDSGNDVERRCHNDDAEQIGNNVAQDNLRIAGARCTRCLNKLLLLELERLTTYIARHQRPCHEGQR